MLALGTSQHPVKKPTRREHMEKACECFLTDSPSELQPMAGINSRYVSEKASRWFHLSSHPQPSSLPRQGPVHGGREISYPHGALCESWPAESVSIIKQLFWATTIRSNLLCSRSNWNVLPRGFLGRLIKVIFPYPKRHCLKPHHLVWRGLLAAWNLVGIRTSPFLSGLAIVVVVLLCFSSSGNIFLRWLFPGSRKVVLRG